MGSIKKSISKLIPKPVMAKYVYFKKSLKWKGKSPEEVFTTIYKQNGWSGHESVSGRGSDPDQTKVIAAELPSILRQAGIQSMLDLPCGDFHWMKDVKLEGIRYTGGDIVKELIEENKKKYTAENRSFEHLDLLKGPLPKVDAIFCRDCLVHFSYENIWKALHTIVDSGSTYLLTTSFTDREKNYDITTGNWRPLNLQKAPFNLPAPIMIFNEKCTEGDGEFGDKCMVLWKVSDIAALLKK